MLGNARLKNAKVIAENAIKVGDYLFHLNYNSMHFLYALSLLGFNTLLQAFERLSIFCYLVLVTFFLCM